MNKDGKPPKMARVFVVFKGEWEDRLPYCVYRTEAAASTEADRLNSEHNSCSYFYEEVPFIGE